MTQVSQENVAGIVVLQLHGSLTLAELPPIEARFAALARSLGPQRVILDLQEVDAIGTPAITLMLRTARHLKEAGGEMVLAGLRPRIFGVFACCRLDLVLNIARDVDAALDALLSEKGYPQLAMCDPLAAELAGTAV